MLEVLGKPYYIDVDKIIERCRPKIGSAPKENKGNENNKKQVELKEQVELNVFKFECYKSCLDRVLNEFQGEDDPDVVQFTNKSSNPSFAIAFNTLLKNEILNGEE